MVDVQWMTGFEFSLGINCMTIQVSVLKAEFTLQRSFPSCCS